MGRSKEESQQTVLAVLQNTNLLLYSNCTYSCLLYEVAPSPTLVVENLFPLLNCWYCLVPVQSHWGEILLVQMACCPLTYCLDL